MAHAWKHAACTVGPNCTVWHRTFAHTVLYGVILEIRRSATALNYNAS
jgi:hypothetical protein